MACWQIMVRDVVDGVPSGHAQLADYFTGTVEEAYGRAQALTGPSDEDIPRLIYEPLTNWDILRWDPDGARWNEIDKFTGTMSQVNDRARALEDANGGTYSATGDPNRAP